MFHLIELPSFYFHEGRVDMVGCNNYQPPRVGASYHMGSHDRTQGSSGGDRASLIILPPCLLVSPLLFILSLSDPKSVDDVPLPTLTIT